MFGKPVSPRTAVRHKSMTMDWSDTDSSVDSMPSSEEEEDEDWPTQTGFHVSSSLFWYNNVTVDSMYTCVQKGAPRGSLGMRLCF